MQTVHVFKYSQIVETDKLKAIKQFSDMAGLEINDVIQIASTEEKPEGIIYEYKIGKLANADFRQALNSKLKQFNGKELNDNDFDLSWNDMCEVKEETFAKLYDLQQKHEFGIHVIGHTNELQHQYIQDKIQTLQKVPEIKYTLSFEVHSLKENDLFKSMLNQYDIKEIPGSPGPRELKLAAEEKICDYSKLSEEHVAYITDQYSFQSHLNDSRSALEILGDIYSMHDNPL